MLNTTKIQIKMIGKNKKYYSQFGYDVNNEIIEIKIEDLPKSSSRLIQCTCDDCGKEMDMIYQNYNKGIEKNGKTICNKCNRKYVINPFSKQEIKDKIKETLKKNYGVDHPSRSKEIMSRRDVTMIEKYGTIHALQNLEIKEKMKEKINSKTVEEKANILEKRLKSTDTKKARENFEKTMLKKYGVLNALENSVIKEKMKIKINDKTIKEKEKSKNTQKETNYLRYGNEYPLRLEEFKEKSRKTKRKNSIELFLKKYNNLNVIDVNYDKQTIRCICDIHGEYELGHSVFYHRIRDKHTLCIKCNPLGTYVESENQLLDFIKSIYNDLIITHNRKILNNEYELDIYLPDLNLAFEFNGLYWHSEIHKENNYHLNKTELCEKNGIRLIHIYEDQWFNKPDIVKSRILNLLGKSEKIFARKCIVKEINDNKLIKKFLETNHLQGFVGSKIKLGLFHNDKLVSLMTFGGQRKSMGQNSLENSYEMIRFCNKLNTNVIGGASRLFKHFVKNYKPIEVISYADRSWSQGNLYEKLGFEFVHKTKPNYYYIINGQRKYRFGFRKDLLLKQGFESNKTEHEIMLDRKIYRIYDSGNLKYMYRN